jgi:very-short-patch-repair endonuclease
VSRLVLSSQSVGGVQSVFWSPHPSIQLLVFEAEGDLWFASKTLARLFSVTVQNIQIHLRDLQESGQQVSEVAFPVEQTEGVRAVSRQIKHYPFEIAHAIAVRAQRFRELEWLLDFSKARGIDRKIYRIAPIKERRFGDLLEGMLDGIVSISRQHHVPPYFVDFFLPEWKIAIEYDERYHSSPKQVQADDKRQAFIEKSLGARVLRVAVGMEIEALNEILKIGFELVVKEQIVSEMRRVNRVNHDITSGPPKTIEKER